MFTISETLCTESDKKVLCEIPKVYVFMNTITMKISGKWQQPKQTAISHIKQNKERNKMKLFEIHNSS